MFIISCLDTQSHQNVIFQLVKDIWFHIHIPQTGRLAHVKSNCRSSLPFSFLSKEAAE